MTAQEVSATSDKKFKTNIITIKNPIEKISKLRGVMFDWKKDEYPEFSDRKQMGVIAQEVEEVIPEVVLNKDHKSVCYDKMVALLIEGIKEQQNKIKNLEDKISTLGNELYEKMSGISNRFIDHETAITLVNNNLCGYIEDNLKKENNSFNNYKINNVSKKKQVIYSV